MAVAYGFADYEVSIHAPARGATSERHDLHLSGQVSIHAPARGATATPISAPVG